MTIEAAVPELVGESRDSGRERDRIEGLIESQTSRYRPNSSDWLVLPWKDGFYLFSEDTEGQRRGRESARGIPRAQRGFGRNRAGSAHSAVRLPDTVEGRRAVICASYLHRVIPGQPAPMRCSRESRTWSPRSAGESGDDWN